MITAELRIPNTLSKCQNLGELSYIYNSKQEILDITLLRSVIFISMFNISALMVNEKHFRGAVKTFGLIENYSFTVSQLLLRVQLEVYSPSAWAFFMALLISFCFLPQRPRKKRLFS